MLVVFYAFCELMTAMPTSQTGVGEFSGNSWSGNMVCRNVSAERNYKNFLWFYEHSFVAYSQIYMVQQLGYVANSSGVQMACLCHSELDLLYVHHILNCSRDSPVGLVLDNRESHISVETINLCKENGVTVLTFPPHCSHRLQPWT